jgi:hypothetical protein
MKRLKADQIIELQDYANTIIRMIKRISINNECSIQLITNSMEYDALSDGRWYLEKLKAVECDFSIDEFNYIKKYIKLRIVCYITTHTINGLTYTTISW